MVVRRLSVDLILRIILYNNNTYHRDPEIIGGGGARHP